VLSKSFNKNIKSKTTIMKKIIVIAVVFILAITNKSFAGTIRNEIKMNLPAYNRPDTGKDNTHKETIEIYSWSWGASNPATGAIIVQVPNGKGILKFTKTGDRFSNVIFTDASGKVQNLQPARPGVNGAPQPACKYPLPDACFATADKNIGLCMCKPTDLSAHPDGYIITLILPAVQKIREAAQN
jgi:hypothetical protein